MAPSIQAPICDRRGRARCRARSRRDLDRQAELAAAHAPVQVGVVGDRRLLDEVARAGDIERVVAAGRGLVAVEHGEGQVLDVHVDAVAHDEHQDDAAEQRQRGADRIAAQFQRLAPGVAEHAAQARSKP